MRAPPGRRWAPHLALALLVACLLALSVHGAAVLRRPPDPGRAKFAAAERTIVYRVTREGGPRFRIEPGAAPIKLVSHVVVADDYQANRRVRYGLRLTIEHEGMIWWQRDVHDESRQSKARRDGDVWRDEAAFTADGLELADERVVIIEPPVVPPGSTLALTLLGASDEAVVRLFRGDTRDAAGRGAAVERLEESERWELVRSSTYVPWELLPQVERDRRLQRRWVRMSALGDRDTDYRARTIFVSDFRAPLVTAVDRQEGIDVSRHEQAALNVVGPATLTLAVAEPRAGAVLEVHTVGSSPGRWRLPLDQPATSTIELAAGPSTLVVATEAEVAVRFTMTGPEVAWLAPVKLRAAAPQLIPHRIRIPLVMAGPERAVTTKVRAVPGAPLLGRVLRVDARVVAPDRDPTAELSFAFVAADGRVVARDRVVVGGPRSRFERLSLAGALEAISEPSATRIVAPAGAVQIEVLADRPVALRLYRWVGGATELEEPYRSAGLADHRWRYVTPTARSWVPLLPANHDRLAAEGRLADLHAQVRLEPIGDGGYGATGVDMVARGAGSDADRASVATPGGGGPRLVAIEPAGHPETQRAREPVPPEQLGAVLATWPAGSVTAVTAGVERTLDFAIARPGRPRLQWETTAAGIGAELTATIGAAPPTRVRLATTRGAIDLPRVTPARYPFHVTAPAGTRLWIDRPPVGDRSGVYRERNLYSMAAPVVVRVVRRGGERVRLHAVVYAAEPAASPGSAVRISIGGGRPLRRTGVALAALTVADRTASLPAARRPVPARLVDLGDRAAGLPRTISVALLDDLVVGSHDIAFYNVSGAELWVRFVASAAPTTAAPDPRQWRVLPETWEGDDVP